MSRSSLSYATVYLARIGNPIWQTRAFLDSYFSNDPGEITPLYLLHKGYPESKVDPALLELPEHQRNRIRLLWVSDDGLSLLACYKVCQLITEFDYLLFLNSHSFIESKDWALLYQNALIETKGNALIGTTGCWEGLSKLGLTFPEPHVRTNAFLIRKTTFMAAYKTPRLTKTECLFFESGPDSFSNYCIAQGIEIFILDSSGKLFSPDKWKQSKTFRSGDQINLIISDNATRHFWYSRNSRREKMSKSSWGENRLNSKRYLFSWLVRRFWSRNLYFGYRWRFLIGLKKRMQTVRRHIKWDIRAV